ncbi:hypothetical protein [Roseobacter sp. MH60115]|uniref:hypothetical protein n=1 Tax=Roseobacter sp. MH60115 TaxID=2785324 RepID=UPI0018A249C9|nr:hypothetical protein [Roseobacter sp. MH60115]
MDEHRITQIEADLQRVMRRLFPEEFKRPGPPPPDPLEDLFGAPQASDDHYLKVRWDALTDHRACFLDADEHRKARAEYMDTQGSYLPDFYVKDGEVIDGKTGKVVTRERELRKIIRRARASIKQMARDQIDDDPEMNWTPVQDAHDKLQEAEIGLAKLKGNPRLRERS